MFDKDVISFFLPHIISSVDLLFYAFMIQPEPEVVCKFLPFVFGCVVTVACVCFVAVVPPSNSLESVC